MIHVEKENSDPRSMNMDQVRPYLYIYIYITQEPENNSAAAAGFQFNSKDKLGFALCSQRWVVCRVLRVKSMNSTCATLEPAL